MSRDGAADLWKQSGMGPKDIHLVQVHDAFVDRGARVLRAARLLPRGRGREAHRGRPLRARRQACRSRPTAGSIARGHPGGPTGLAQIWETVHQLRGTAGKRQVPNARVGPLPHDGRRQRLRGAHPRAGLTRTRDRSDRARLRHDQQRDRASPRAGGAPRLATLRRRRRRTTTFRSLLYVDPEAPGANGLPPRVVGRPARDRATTWRPGSAAGSSSRSRPISASRLFTTTNLFGVAVPARGPDRRSSLRELRAAAEARPRAARRAPSSCGRPARFSGAETPEDDAFAERAAPRGARARGLRRRRLRVRAGRGGARLPAAPRPRGARAHRRLRRRHERLLARPARRRRAPRSSASTASRSPATPSTPG